MLLFICSFLVSFAVSLMLVRSADSHAHLSGDTDQEQPQKFHTKVVPRIGGIAIMAAVVFGCVLIAARDTAEWRLALTLISASMIAFGAGLIEDFTKRVSPLQRLLATIAAAAVAAKFGGALITRTDIPGLENLMLIAGFPMLLTLVGVAGVANSINIIDGFNGLASMSVAIMLAALGFVAYRVGDTIIMYCALVSIGAVLGFFVWNFPFGNIFLGDGGAYFLGFWVAELGILLVHRNASVSPMLPLLVCFYPIFETLFTMYRRRVVRGRPMGLPDATHLHSLIYRRIMRRGVNKADSAELLRRNSMTSPALWALNFLAALPALFWWNSTRVLALAMLLFAVSYVLLYRAIVHFKSPRILHLISKTRNARNRRRQQQQRRKTTWQMPVHDNELTSEMGLSKSDIY